MRGEEHERFDIVGMVLAGLGIGGMAFGLSVLGLNFLPWTVVAGWSWAAPASLPPISRTPAASTTRRWTSRYSAFRPSSPACVGGFIFRLGLGALPFLLPLMLQIGFGMTPFQSGMITFATALGAMGMKWATANILRRFGFRNILVVNSHHQRRFSRGLRRLYGRDAGRGDDGPAVGRRIFPLAAIHQHQYALPMQTSSRTA